MCYTAGHRAQVEQRLLDIVKSQIRIYSQRNLSIRGRTTITNSLILSKGALSPEDRFYSDGPAHGKRWIRSLTPPTSTASNATTMDWLYVTIDDSTSFLTPIMLHHLSLIPSMPSDHRRAFFFKELRQGPLCDHTHTARLWFTAFDAIPVRLPIDRANVTNCLSLPLHRLLILPPSQWLHKIKYQRLMGANFFIYDEQQHSLRPKIPREHQRPRYLLRRLYRDLLTATPRRVDLQQWMWSLIDVPRTPDALPSLDLMIQGFLDDPYWYLFNNKRFRSYLLPGSLPPYKCSSRIIQSFWSARMSPEARTIWYKILVQKVPLQPLLPRLHPQDPHCIHCHRDEDLAHFVYLCPKKRPILEAVLSRHLLLQFLRPSPVLDFILYLRSPPPSLPLAQTLTLFSTVIHRI